MIPKIIHYTWFSGEPFPEKIQACIDSWHKYMPEYEFVLWDAERISEINSIFLLEALAARKWAYAADYVRLYALVNYGGIYLDTDALVLKSLTPFLQHKAFIGKETSIHFTGDRSEQYLSSHAMGAEPGHPFMRDCLDYFTDRHFVQSGNERLPAPLRFNQVLLPYIQAEIAKLYGCDLRPLTQNIQECKEGLIVYPSDYFDVSKKTPNNTVCHLALGSWREDNWRKEYNYTFAFKLQWRFIYFFKWVLEKFGYVSYKLE